MHPKLYQKIIRVRQKLLQLQQRFRDRVKTFDPSGVWHPWRGKTEKVACAAADGSFNYIKRLGFYLAGATGASTAFPMDRPPENHYLAELDVMLAGRISEEQVISVMQTGSKIMELRALNQAARSVPEGVLLVDGSLAGLSRNYLLDMSETRIARLARSKQEQEEEEMIGQQNAEVLDKLKTWAHNSETALDNLMDKDWAAWELFQDLREMEEVLGFALASLMMLSRMEYLKLLKAFSHRAKDAIGISKSASDAQLNPDVPDIYLLSVATFAPGYTEPQALEIPAVPGFQPGPASFFYARTEPGRPVFRVEMMSPPDQIDPEKQLAILTGLSVAGYPYPLAKAHKLCTLSFKAMEGFLGLAGGRTEPTGREAL